MQKKTIRILLIAVLVFASMVAAAPARDSLARFTVENRTAATTYVRLMGDSDSYFLTNPGSETSVWTVARDNYDYSIYACGVWTTGEIDLTTPEKLVIPECGSQASATGQGGNVIDHGQLLKLTRYSLVNATSTKTLLVAVYGNGVSYVFKLAGDTPLEITLPRGEFHFTAYGCYGSWTGTFSVDYPGAKHVFKCP